MTTRSRYLSLAIQSSYNFWNMCLSVTTYLPPWITSVPVRIMIPRIVFFRLPGPDVRNPQRVYEKVLTLFPRWPVFIIFTVSCRYDCRIRNTTKTMVARRSSNRMWLYRIDLFRGDSVLLSSVSVVVVRASSQKWSNTVNHLETGKSKTSLFFMI